MRLGDLRVELDGVDLSKYVESIALDAAEVEPGVVYDFFVDGTEVSATLWPPGLRELVETGVVGDELRVEGGRIVLADLKIQDDGTRSVLLARYPA